MEDRNSQLSRCQPINAPRYRSTWSLAHVDSLATLCRSTAALYRAWCQGVQAKRMGVLEFDSIPFCCFPLIPRK